MGVTPGQTGDEVGRHINCIDRPQTRQNTEIVDTQMPAVAVTVTVSCHVDQTTTIEMLFASNLDPAIVQSVELLFCSGDSGLDVSKKIIQAYGLHIPPVSLGPHKLPQPEVTSGYVNIYGPPIIGDRTTLDETLVLKYWIVAEESPIFSASTRNCTEGGNRYALYIGDTEIEKRNKEAVQKKLQQMAPTTPKF